MNVAEFKLHLRKNPLGELRFRLPDGDLMPAHAHITEVGRINKTFIDCGGTIRQANTCLLQAWVADDTEHRLVPGKLADILDRANDVLQSDELPVEIEFEDCVISQFPLESVIGDDESLTFSLATKHTDCLAKEVCLPKTASCC